MRGLHLGLSDLEGFLVGLLRVVQHSCPLVTNSHLGKVPVVITFHLQIKHLGLGIAGFGNKVLVQKVLKLTMSIYEIKFTFLGFSNNYKDVSTNVVELLLNLLAVLLGHGLFLFGALRLLLNGGNDTPG